MPINESLLELLVCPATKTRLSCAPEGLLSALNREIEAGALCNRGGAKVAEKLEEGLLTADGEWLYPVRAGIPVLLIEEAIKTGA